MQGSHIPEEVRMVRQALIEITSPGILVLMVIAFESAVFADRSFVFSMKVLVQLQPPVRVCANNPSTCRVAKVASSISSSFYALFDVHDLCTTTTAWKGPACPYAIDACTLHLRIRVRVSV